MSHLATPCKAANPHFCDRAWYDPIAGEIVLTQNALDVTDEMRELGLDAAATALDAALTHEVQHAIQEAEQWSDRTRNNATSGRDYQNAMSEVDARAQESILLDEEAADLAAEDAEPIRQEEFEDVPRSKQIDGRINADVKCDQYSSRRGNRRNTIDPTIRLAESVRQNGIVPKPVLQSFIDGIERSFETRDQSGMTHRLLLVRGSRRHGMMKILLKHLVDGGLATTGGFTARELNDYWDAILREGRKEFARQSGNLTIAWKAPDGVSIFCWNIPVSLWPRCSEYNSHRQEPKDDTKNVGWDAFSWNTRFQSGQPADEREPLTKRRRSQAKSV